MKISSFFTHASLITQIAVDRLEIDLLKNTKDESTSRIMSKGLLAIGSSVKQHSFIRYRYSFSTSTVHWSLGHSYAIAIHSLIIH